MASTRRASSAKLSTPADGLAGLKENWRFDLTSGFILFLVALPLSAGIAIASGAPPTAGILAAVVGGIVGGLIGGSYVTINGPAAGMIVVVLAAVQALGMGDSALGFQRTLAAVMIAGILQVGLGFLRAGGLGLAFPTAVIHGMLMAIGVIIMSKQVHVLLGVAPESKEVLGLIAEIPHSVANMNPDIALIGFLSLAILIALNFNKIGWLKRVPGPLLVVVVGITLGFYFDLEHQHTVRVFMKDYSLGPNFLLNVPQNFRDAIILPRFDMVWTGAFARMALSIALVGTIESILSAYAVDKMDPYKRSADLNKELWSKGICNTICGAIGALPVIAEIVRSTANVANGARTRWSNFFHGVFLLIFIVAFPHLLHEIPLACLAAVLVVVGFRLAHPKQLTEVWHVGWDQSVVFVSTLLVTLATDLLIGVASGVVIELVLNGVRGGAFVSLFRLNHASENGSEHMTLKINSPAVFSNFLALKRLMDGLEKGTTVELDLREARLVDHTVMEHLHRYQDELQQHGITLKLKFSESHAQVGAAPLSGRRLGRG
jgi:MFS superfamily sulfate permease-like transporter